MKHVVMLLLAVALFAAPAVAQDAPKAAKVDITGQWTMTVETPQGQMTITANYKQDGETLTGNHVSEMGEAPLKGTVKGNEVNYTLTMDMGGQALSIVHKAKVDGDTMTGTADLGDMGNITYVAKRKK